MKPYDPSSSPLDYVPGNARQVPPTVRPSANFPSSGKDYTLSEPVFHLINGSFRSFAAASRFVETLDQKGIEASVLLPESDLRQLFRVASYSSSDRSEVESVQEQLKQEFQLPGWILKVE